MELKHKLENIFNNDYPGTERFIADVIEPIFGNEIEYINDDLAERESYAEKAKNAGIKHIKYIGDLTEKNYNADNIALLDVTLDDSKNIERSRVNIQQLIRSIMDYRQHLMIIFHYEDVTNRQWRFSYAYKGDSLKDTTSAKRYTYVFGHGYRGRTAAERFEVLAKSPRNNEDFEKAFSVEALSDEFFDKYRNIYADFVELITGKRYEKEKGAYVEKFKHNPDPQFASTFDNKDKTVRDYVKKMFGRIVFLYFLQRKGWLYDSDGKSNPTYMHDLFANFKCKNNFLDGCLETLFFRVLNTDKPNRDAKALSLPGGLYIPYLNGGLFQEDDIDQLNCVFPAEYFQKLFDFLDSYNFTIDENDREDAEIGIDPEMLGRIFENLLEDNKDKGAFYTPKEIVDYMCRESIIAYLQDDKFSQDGNERIREFIETQNVELLNERQRDYIEDRLIKVKICDPAIGSGAFPMGLVNLLSKLFIALRTYKTIDQGKMKRYIMQNSIYGVDIEKGAVDIARLRFWLAMVVDEVEPQPLPNLNFKIMQGNSLLEHFNGLDLSTLMKRESGRIDFITDTEREQLRSDLNRYYAETNHEVRDKIMQSIKNTVVRMILNANPDSPLSGIDVSETDKFFLWHTWFSDVFDKGGFDIVIGNPPYIDSETMTQLGMEDQRRYIANNFKYISGNWDIYMAFLEKGLSMSNGILCFITPDKWLSKPFGKLFRKECMTKRLKSIVHSGSKVFESATVDAIISLFVRESQNITAYIFNSNKEIEQRGSVRGPNLQNPYLIDSLFSPYASLISVLEQKSSLQVHDIANCEGACSTADAYKLIPLISDVAIDDKSYRLVNTGTLDKFGNRWGIKEIVYLAKELGYKPKTPYVSISDFEATFGKAYVLKAKGPKIILKGLNLLDAFVDEGGIFLPGKTTLVINNKNINELHFICAILNSAYAIFYIRTKYSSSSYCGGITFTKDMINALPIPVFSDKSKEFLIKLSKKASELRSVDCQADIKDVMHQINLVIFKGFTLTYDEMVIVDPQTSITREEYKNFNLDTYGQS